MKRCNVHVIAHWDWSQFLIGGVYFTVHVTITCQAKPDPELARSSHGTKNSKESVFEE